MRKSIAITILVGLVLLNGCGLLSEDEFSGKTFTIRTELRSGDGVEVVTWENATDLEYNDTVYIYQFYVEGKLVLLDPQGTVIVEEQ